MAKEKTTTIRPQAGFQEEFVRSNVDVVFGGGVLASGKAMIINELVLTPTGWREIGDLKVGDIVCSPFSGDCVVKGVYPQGVKPIYEFVTDDGRRCEASADHYWSVRTRKQLDKYIARGENKWFSLMTTEEIGKRLSEGRKTFLPLPDAQEFREKEYVVPPYVLGVMLGDGSLGYEGYTKQLKVIVSSDERDIIDKCASMLDATKVTYHGTNNYDNCIYTPRGAEIRNYITSVGLNVKSPERFIPEEYLWGSIRQRRELLAGLFDTDGCVNRKNRYAFCTTSRRMRDDFVYLCRSLGYEATWSLDKRSDKYTSGECFSISIHTDDVIFTSAKHLARHESHKEYLAARTHTKGNRHVTIKSVKYLRDAEAVCIYVDNPYHLFITRDFIVTHNTFGAVLSVAEPSADPNFRGLFLRNNLGDLKSGGGVLDNFRDAYGKYVEITESGDPRVTFPSGARIDVTHVSDQSKEKVMQRFKGRQYDLIYFDELTGFTWECFSAICTRNRGKGLWTGKIRATTNPERKHWLRKFLDWYIGLDGFIREDRAGVVRYFYMAGESVRDVVWGNTKEEVYRRCQADIDRRLAKINGKTGTATYENLIKSFTFYLGKMSENTSMLENNNDYVGSVAIMGGRNAQQLLEGNWNVSPEEELAMPITQELAMDCFTNDPQVNGDRWITADLADTGTDNFVAVAWDGFHVIDLIIAGQTTPRTNAELLKRFAEKHDVADSHIVYDAVRGTYISDYIPEAVQYSSVKAPMGMYGHGFVRLKDECYYRLVEAIRRGQISFSSDVAKRKYEHANIREFVSVEAEFIDECSVVMFEEGVGGKKSLISKKRMNLKLGRNRSMDLLDPFAMRMYPVLRYAYGEELDKTASDYVYKEFEDEDYGEDECDIYDENMYC